MLGAAARDTQGANGAVRRLGAHVTPISRHTVRITLAEQSGAVRVPRDGSLLESIPAVTPQAIAETGPRGAATDLKVQVDEEPLAIRVGAPGGRVLQQLRVNAETGALSFSLGDAPVLGLGQGGPQFDRRGHADRMRSGQGGYRLRTHGGRVPVQWLIGASGWAMFIHQPLGSFDFTGTEGQFTPFSADAAFPLDIFVVDASDPAQAMAEYARLTGNPEMPPLWSLGYQQSHRTLASREEILGIARTFREKRLPCDALIYLGTGFTPSGWNTANGSFQFNSRVFDDPQAIFDEFHAMNFRVVLHSVILTRTLRGAAADPCPVERFDMEEVACAWNAHRKNFVLGVDGWWPDEGDPLNAESRLTRNRMYYEGPQMDRPNQRPYALHRNGHAGMQRYAPFLWSGDVYSTWETLRTHVPVAVNTGLSGIHLWGTDIGGFVPTKEFTGELYVRWFQFGAFCPLFRSHGRTWKLRLPWGWNTGELGPDEVANYRDAANPDPSELHNAEVEPICRKYLELRYRLLPYLYTAVRESHETGLPILRALWLHYSDDATAVARGDQYLWGRDVLVAPVTEKGAAARRVYLPRGEWYDFWTEERLVGGREINRDVNLATMPLYVRAGTILPLGPVKQYTSEKVDGPMTLVIYPGADGSYTLYEDDGASFAYRRGAWVKTEMKWDNAERRLTLRLASGSRPGTPGLPPRQRPFEVRIAGDPSTRTIGFTGAPLSIQLDRTR
ncbi:MAG: TIM-barrel domain-containing protein [Candidatus Acidiferrales bacterium]